MTDSKEFFKKFDTCAAKWNIIFDYKGTAEIKTWEEIGVNTFAVIRNYAEFSAIVVQRLILLYFPDEQHDFKTPTIILDGIDKYLDMVLEKIDRLP